MDCASVTPDNYAATATVKKSLDSLDVVVDTVVQTADR